MNILLVGWDAAGGLMPMLGLAKRLAERGHDVRLLGNSSIDRRCAAHGWRFRPFGKTPDYDVIAAKNMSTELQTNMRNLWLNPAVAGDLLAELDRESADVLVVDCMLWAGLSAAVATGIPTAAFFHQPYSAFVSRDTMLLAPLNVARTQMHLPPVVSVDALYRQCDLGIVTVPRELEAKDVEVPHHVRWVGPVLDSAALVNGAVAPPPLEGKPFVLVSLGTGYQAQLPVLQRLVDAVGQLPWRAVVTTGPAVDPAGLRLPPNVTAVGYTPHDALLPHAALVVTHAGIGTILAALRHGLPLLCVPLGRDQFANAQWVVSVGAGRALPADADVASITAAARLLLEENAPERAAARNLAHIFDGCGGADAAVDALESLRAEAGNSSRRR